jgi:hypothetical protein
MHRALRLLAAVLGMLAAAARAEALAPGEATGTFTYGATTVTLATAVRTTVENLFDDKKQDTLVVLADRALGATAPDDDVELSLRARRGDLTALALRLDGGKLVNVSVYHRGLDGKTLLPGAWFQYAGAAAGGGTLKLAPRAFDGRTYACAVAFAAAPAAAPPAVPAEPPAPPPPPRQRQPEPTPPAATSPTIAPKASVALLVQAIMLKDERQALELIRLGADPDGRDQYGTPVLNWAVMMCQPPVVKALVDKKASLTYQRAPGLTILTEAGACPEAARILRAAGAK